MAATEGKESWKNQNMVSGWQKRNREYYGFRFFLFVNVPIYTNTSLGSGVAIENKTGVAIRVDTEGVKVDQFAGEFLWETVNAITKGISVAIFVCT